MGGFLNPYDFAYRGRDTVNQATKVAQEVIKNVGNERINIAKESISQIITQGGKESERVLPKILRGVIEDVYQTPFRLLENLGKQINKIYICFIYCIFYSFSGRKGPSRFFLIHPFLVFHYMQSIHFGKHSRFPPYTSPCLCYGTHHQENKPLLTNAHNPFSNKFFSLKSNFNSSLSIVAIDFKNLNK